MVRPIKLVSLCGVLAVIAMSTSYANTITASPGMAVKDETDTVTFTAQVGQTQQELDDGWTLSWTVNGGSVLGGSGALLDWEPTQGGEFTVQVDLLDNQNPPVLQASAEIKYSVIDIEVRLQPGYVTQQDDQGRYWDNFSMVGVPAGGTYWWTKSYGPGNVSFLEQNTMNATAYFDEGGTYRLQMTYTLNEQKSKETWEIIVGNGGSGGGGDPQPRVTFSPNPIYVAVGGTAQVTATLTGVTWNEVTITTSEAAKATVQKEGDKAKVTGVAAPTSTGIELRALQGTAGTLLGKANVIVVGVNLALAGLPDDKEENPGGFLCLNDDWDEGNMNSQDTHVPDNQPNNSTALLHPVGHGIDANDVELKALTLDVKCEGLKGKWKLSFPGTVKVWKKKADNTTYEEVVNDQESSEVTLPLLMNFKLEGMAESSSLNDVSIRATFTPKDLTVGFADEIVLTVTRVTFKPYEANAGFSNHSNENGYMQIQPPERPALVLRTNRSKRVLCEFSPSETVDGGRVLFQKQQGATYTVPTGSPAWESPQEVWIDSGGVEEFKALYPKIVSADTTYCKSMLVQVWEPLYADITTWTVNDWSGPTTSEMTGGASSIWSKQAVVSVLRKEDRNVTIQNFPSQAFVDLKKDTRTPDELALWAALDQQAIAAAPVVVVFVRPPLKVDGKDFLGYSLYKGAGRPKELIVITQGTGDHAWTLAHELGHYLGFCFDAIYSGFLMYVPTVSGQFFTYLPYQVASDCRATGLDKKFLHK